MYLKYILANIIWKLWH